MLNVFNAATYMAGAEGLDFDPAVMIEINGIQITETVTTTWIIMGALVVMSVLATRNMDKIPTGIQHFFEVLIDGIHYLVDSTMGVARRGFAPYMLALTLFLVVSNVSGVIGIRNPTASLNTTFVLSGLTFVATQYYGMKEKGVGGWGKSFFEPIPFLVPLNIISELANPVSLGFRLFGNMLGSVVMLGLLYHFAPILIPIIPHLYLDVFVGLIQAFIFVMLTMTYITISMEN